MTTIRPSFHSLDPSDWAGHGYDVALFALGFESRATRLFNKVAPNSKSKFALGFSHGHNEGYSRNREIFQAAGATTFDDLTDQSFEVCAGKLLADLIGPSDQSVFIDISSFSRYRLASVVSHIFKHAQTLAIDQELIVDFGYSLAKFDKPSAERQPNTVVGPAHSAFAGWSQGGYSSTAAVLGLGYEQDQALGVVEYLQAGEVWAFSPTSPISEYKPQVEKANKLLLSELPASRILEYDTCAPLSLLANLDSVVRGLGDSHSVVLVPFGPKIFVLCALLIASLRSEVSVWRVSQGISILPTDRVASGIEIGLRVRFSGRKLANLDASPYVDGP